MPQDSHTSFIVSVKAKLSFCFGLLNCAVNLCVKASSHNCCVWFVFLIDCATIARDSGRPSKLSIVFYILTFRINHNRYFHQSPSSAMRKVPRRSLARSELEAGKHAVEGGRLLKILTVYMLLFFS